MRFSLLQSWPGRTRSPLSDWLQRRRLFSRGWKLLKLKPGVWTLPNQLRTNSSAIFSLVFRFSAFSATYDSNQVPVDVIFNHSEPPTPLLSPLHLVWVSKSHPVCVTLRFLNGLLRRFNQRIHCYRFGSGDGYHSNRPIITYRDLDAPRDNDEFWKIVFRPFFVFWKK